MLKDCSNCQIGPYGGCLDIGRPDIGCAINMLATKIGVWDLAHGKRFYCSAYHKYGTPHENNGNWGEKDQKEYEAVKRMYEKLERKEDKECTDCEIESSSRQCEKCWRNPEDHEHYDTLAKE